MQSIHKSKTKKVRLFAATVLKTYLAEVIKLHSQFHKLQH